MVLIKKGWGKMKELLKNVESFLECIRTSELRSNSRARAKKVEIEQFVSRLNLCLEENLCSSKRVMKYLSPKMLLEN